MAPTNPPVAPFPSTFPLLTEFKIIVSGFSALPTIPPATIPFSLASIFPKLEQFFISEFSPYIS